MTFTHSEAVLEQALLPAARRTMVQHHPDSFADNVTFSVQSWFHKTGISRRALLPAHPDPTEPSCAGAVRVASDTIAAQWKFNQEMDQSEEELPSCSSPAHPFDQAIDRKADTLIYGQQWVEAVRSRVQCLPQSHMMIIGNTYLLFHFNDVPPLQE
ncbi:hypothetical protein Q8A73_010059 [Channa argus]|nr:hypothetical protein Q8A73_010059 [Channa argus]